MVPYFSKFERSQINYPLDYKNSPLYFGNFIESIKIISGFTSVIYVTPLDSRWVLGALRRHTIKYADHYLRNRKPPILILFSRGIFKGDIKAYPRVIRKNPALITLYLQGDFQSPPSEKATLFFNSLKTNHTLTHLGLIYRIMNTEGLLNLGKVLEVNTTLTSLAIVVHNGDETIKENMFFTSLLLNSSLANLTLWKFNSLNLRGRKLASYIACSQVLTRLDIRANNLRDGTGVLLSKALTINTSLQNLNVGHNSFSEVTAMALAEALEVNTTLTTLKMDSNLIGSSGAINLLNALTRNATLTALSMKRTGLGEEVIDRIGSMLLINSSLEKLNIKSNPEIGEMHLEILWNRLEEGLKSNYSLKKLSIPHLGNRADLYTVRNVKVGMTLFKLLCDFLKIGKDDDFSLNSTEVSSNVACSSSGMDNITPLDEGKKIKRVMRGAPALTVTDEGLFKISMIVGEET